MTDISHHSLRVMWLILLSAFTLFLLAAEAASAPPIVPAVVQAGQSQVEPDDAGRQATAAALARNPAIIVHFSGDCFAAPLLAMTRGWVLAL